MNLHTLLLNNKKRLIYGFLGLWLLLPLGACLKDDDGGRDGTVPAALVSFIHTSPDAGDLIVGINGYRVNTQQFKYLDRTVYQLVYPGGNQFQVNTSVDNNKLDVKNWSLEGGVCYSIFAVDRLDSLELLGIRDFYASDVPANGMARVRFINLCPDSVKFDLKTNSVDTLLASDKKFKQNSAFGDIKATDNIAYTLELIDHDSRTPMASTTFTPKQGQYYTILATGFIDTEEEAEKLRVSIFKHE
ncbi:DUF4397 domain-containing protein [Olivibacter sp. CPCC 100613]|uniref:DUF4397 domain-containing protein n=1 Tax=Olivibacter sp. CPCC 100613 TaxID=3079931 RepID=UPI002FFC3ED6